MQTKLSNLSNRLLSRARFSTAGSQERPPDIIPAITTRNRRFASLASLAFGALYAELVLFAYNYYGSGLSSQSVAWGVGGIFILTTLSIWLSFSLPHRIYRPRFNQYSPIIFLMTELTASILIVIAVTLVTLGVGIYLAGGSLAAIGELLRSLALYALVAVVSYHGLSTFVRYVHYLYERELHQSYKVVSVAGGATLVMLIVILYLLQYDLGRMGGAEPQRDLLSLHLSLRCIWLIIMNLFVLIWHFARLADH